MFLSLLLIVIVIPVLVFSYDEPAYEILPNLWVGRLTKEGVDDDWMKSKNFRKTITFGPSCKELCTANIDNPSRIKQLLPSIFEELTISVLAKWRGDSSFAPMIIECHKTDKDKCYEIVKRAICEDDYGLKLAEESLLVVEDESLMRNVMHLCG